MASDGSQKPITPAPWDPRPQAPELLPVPTHKHIHVNKDCSAPHSQDEQNKQTAKAITNNPGIIVCVVEISLQMFMTIISNSIRTQFCI